MDKIAIFRSSFVTSLIPILLIVSLIVLVKSPIFMSNPDLWGIMVTLDLVFTIPFIYFLLIRKREISNKTVIRFFLIGIVVASFIIPVENQFLLDKVKFWILPVVEIFVLFYISKSILRVAKIYKTTRESSLDFLTTVRKSCSELFPKRFANFLAIEFASFYYGVIHWKKIDLKENEFTYNKNTGTESLLAAFIFVTLIETTVLHLWIGPYNSTIAWMLTGLSMYSGFQIFGFLKSLSKRPISISGKKLKLRYGILSEVDIELENINSIEISTKSIESYEKSTYLSPLGDMDGHNLIIVLKEESTLIGLYGNKKKFRTLAFHVDDKSEFVSRLESAMQISSC